MSLIVFIIAAAPAALVWYIGYKSQSKFKIYLTAVLCACAGLLTGNPIYAALDVFLVIVGLVFGLQAQKDQQRRRADAAMRAQFAQTGWGGHKPSTSASDDTKQGWDKRCAEMDAKIAAHRAKLEAKRAEAATAAAAALTPQVGTGVTKVAAETQPKQRDTDQKQINSGNNFPDGWWTIEDFLEETYRNGKSRND